MSSENVLTVRIIIRKPNAAAKEPISRHKIQRKASQNRTHSSTNLQSDIMMILR